jgi:CRP-like cAMP-binding protein
MSMPWQSAYLFQEVSEQTGSEIAQIAIEESYSQGAFLFHVGDPAAHLYILQKGWVRLSVARRGLLSHVMSDPGEAIGWSSMAGNGVYTASAECVIPVTVLKIGKEKLNLILEKDPASGLSFYRRLARMMGRRLVASYGATLSMQFPGDTRSYG